MNKTPSNQGSSSGIADVKYQKAIKQISKLISLNTSLKKEIVTLQENYDKLRADYDTLQQKYNNLEFESQQNKTTTISTPTASNQHRQQDQSIGKAFAYKDHSASGSISQFIQSKRKISDLQQRISQKQQKIASLKRELDQKNFQSGQLYRKYLDVTEQLTKTKANQNIKNFEAIQKERRKLKKQLQQSEQWVKKITSDYELLKKQIMFNDKSSINAKSIELGMSAPITQLRDPLSDFYFQKLRKAESENIRLKKEYTDKKMKLKVQLTKLKDENQQQLSKLMHLTSFVQKQQVFIQKFILSQKTQNV